MKKINILMAGALALFAASCEKDLEPAQPQENPQLPILTTGDITTNAGGVFADLNQTLKLEAYKASAMIPVLGLPVTENLPEGAEVEYKVQLAADDSFAKVVTLNTILGETEETSSTYYVMAEDWNNAHIELFGRDPQVQHAYFRVPVYVNLDNTDFRYDSVDYYGLTGEINEACMDNGVVIESSYTLVLNGTDKVAFTHPAGGSPYDHPQFEVKFKVTDDDLNANGGVYKWQIIAGDNAGILGPEAGNEENMSGTLTAENPVSGQIMEAGKYLLSVNMWSLEYSIEQLLQPNMLYTPGDSNGWNQEGSAWLQLKDGNYYGASPLRGGFKICENPDWSDNSANWGIDPSDPTKLMSGQEAGNIPVDAAGLYWIDVTYDTEADGLGTITMTELTKVGLIGSFEGSNWGTDLEMDAVLDEDGNMTGDWTADLTIKSGQEFKVRFNGNWDYNFGGDIEAMNAGGDNIKATEDGTFKVTLHLLGGYPRITMEKQ